MKLFGNSKAAARTKKHVQTPCDDNRTGWQSIRKWKRVTIILLSVFLVLAIGLAVFLNSFVKPPAPPAPVGPANSETNQQGDSNVEQTDGLKPGFYNILLAGTDNDGLRTDTMMIARLDTVNDSVALMSIPRDTMIELNGRVAKLNSVYGVYGCGQAGMEALMLEIEKILGFMPSGYALVDLDMFMELVDAIGGVYYDVPERMYHNDPTQNLLIDLQPGYQHLDGEKAMQLVRYRGYAQADIQRTKVQQEFIIKVVKQCLSKPGKISDYIDIFSRNVVTNFTAGNLLYFGQELLQCDLSTMVSYTLPGRDVWTDAAYYDLIDEEVAAIVEKDFNPYVN